MIRYVPRSCRSSSGLSLAEIAFVLLVIGLVLGLMWLKAATVFRNYEVIAATRELNQLVTAIRVAHQGDKIGQNENIDALNLPVDMIGHYHDQTLLFNPWRGLVSILEGSAIAEGHDTLSDEFTIRYDSVPSDACVEFVMEGSKQEIRSLGLNNIYVAPYNRSGNAFCFAEDRYCRDLVATLDKQQVGDICHQQNRMSVFFTFSSH